MKRYIDRYDVSWHSPASRPADTMPVGNGDLAADVRTAPDGDIVVTLAKSDAWDECGSLLKLGRIRIRLSPRLIRGNEPFNQRLRVEKGMVEITAGAAAARRAVRVWVDAHEPTVWVEIDSPSPQHVTVFANLWRLEDRDLGPAELGGLYGWTGCPDPPPRTADTIVDDSQDHLIWYHHNDSSRWFETWETQGLGAMVDRGADPLLGRTFGCLVRGQEFHRTDRETLRTREPVKTATLQIVARTDIQDSPAPWLHDIVQLGTSQATRDVKVAWQAHVQWWAAFWDRSYIHVGSVTDTAPQSAAFRVSSGYQLQRYLSACAGRGRFPIKHNGSLFTFATNVKGEAVDPDYRRWGGLYWFQNTRLAYWPMLATGDWEMMRPLFDMYEAALPMARARCRHYFDHDGAHFPETMTFWGAYGNDNYGWERDGLADGDIANEAIRRHYTGMLELLALMLDYVAATRDRAYLRDHLLPMASDILAFFASHYDLDDQGRLLMLPAQALETYTRGVQNPMPDVAGLHWVLERLLSDHADVISSELRRDWQALADALPPLPTGERDGRSLLLPAERYENQTVNMELPELYAVFPFRLYHAASPALELAYNAFHDRQFQYSGGWHQDGIFGACLGLADVAWGAVVDHLGGRATESRFPGYRGPNFNWIPDQDQGNVGMIALQHMLLQETENGLHLLPAWPADVDVYFRLCAAGGVTVQGAVVGGRPVRIDARDAEGDPVSVKVHHPQTRRTKTDTT